MSKYIFILGNNPPLSIAELKARYSDAKLEVIKDDFITLRTDTMIDQNEFNHLGGSIKAGEVIAETQKNELINEIGRASCRERV